jgi:hypothetical protein
MTSTGLAFGKDLRSGMVCGVESCCRIVRSGTLPKPERGFCWLFWGFVGRRRTCPAWGLGVSRGNRIPGPPRASESSGDGGGKLP